MSGFENKVLINIDSDGSNQLGGGNEPANGTVEMCGWVVGQVSDHHKSGDRDSTKLQRHKLLVPLKSIREDHSTAADIPKSNAAAQTDAEVKAIFEDIHSAYLCLVSSPFYVPGTPINPSLSAAARKFDQVIDRILSNSPTTSKL
ncbi:hypothetical protein ACTXT7_002845 [Hymenolepis weldensis]